MNTMGAVGPEAPPGSRGAGALGAPWGNSGGGGVKSYAALVYHQPGVRMY